jgi:hypothetical protein
VASACQFGGVSTFSSFNRGCSSTSRASYIASVLHALLSFRRAYPPTAISRRACGQLQLCSRPNSVTNRYHGDTQCRIRDGAVLRLWRCCHARSTTRIEPTGLSDRWASCRMPGFRTRGRRRVSRNYHTLFSPKGRTKCIVMACYYMFKIRQTSLEHFFGQSFTEYTWLYAVAATFYSFGNAT